MAVMYSVLGVVAAATGAVFGSAMANPFVVWGIALLFVVFAASMFGAFEIVLPAGVQTRLAAVGGAGYAGVFAAGLVAGIVAAPCTGPVLGAVLTYIAATGDIRFGFMAMFAFALGMGMLFILIGTFSARVVPKSGPWLEKIKSVFGIIMLATALYFVKDTIPPPKLTGTGQLYAFGSFLLLIMIGLLIGAVHLRFVAGARRDGSAEDPPSLSEIARKCIGIILCVAGIYGVTDLVITPTDAPLPSGETGVTWLKDDALGRELARRQGKPMVIDAYADWCVACKELDALTFADPQVRERLEGFVAVRFDFTRTTPENRLLRQKYGIVGLPTVMVFDTAGNERRERRLLGFEPPDKFLRRLGYDAK
jgi:thiol:disulfide interchange protein DsbD